MAAHIQIAAAFHKNNAYVRLGIRRRRQQGAEHVPVPTGLQHYGPAQMIPMGHKILLLFHHGVPPELGETLIQNTGGLPHGVGIDGLKHILARLQLGRKGHGLPP